MKKVLDFFFHEITLETGCPFNSNKRQLVMVLSEKL